MVLVRALFALTLLLVGACATGSQHEQTPVSQQLQLQQLLAPVLQQAALWAQPNALTQLVRLQLAIEQLDPGKLQPVKCELQPSPVVSGADPPSTRACARSCLQLRDQASEPLQDGVYWLRDLPVPVFCDFSHDGGGWTLLLTSISRNGWDALAALERNENSPSLSDNYSILRHANSIRDLGKGESFAYRLEAQADTGRRRWGGVWLAPRAYSFVQEAPTQTDVKLVRRFDQWAYKDDGIEKLMPRLNLDSIARKEAYIVTTSGPGNWWGTLVTHEWETAFDHSPWIHPEAPRSGTVLYWMREEAA